MGWEFEFSLNDFFIDLNRLIGIEWWKALEKKKKGKTMKIHSFDELTAAIS